MTILPVILLEDSGEFGNRVVTYCYLLACSHAFNISVLNCCFWRYRYYFARVPKLISRPGGRPAQPGGRPLSTHSVGCFWCRWPIIGPLHRTFVFDGSSLWRTQIIVERISGWLLRSTFRSRLGRFVLSRWYYERRIVIDGHGISLAVPRSFKPDLGIKLDLAQQAERLRSYWEIRGEYVAVAKAIKRECGASSKMIGLHVRRGDYAVYRSGKWLFTDDQYSSFARRLVAVAGPPHACVVVVSNSLVKGLLLMIPGSIPGPGHLIGDLCALGMCDLIAGPPSTFSGTASFLFNKPLYWMESGDQRPEAQEQGRSWVPEWY